MALRLHVVFLGLGLRWPLRAEDTIEMWSDDHECVGTMSGAAIKLLIEHHIATAELQAVITRDLRRPLAQILTPALRATRRTARRSRKP